MIDYSIEAKLWQFVPAEAVPSCQTIAAQLVLAAGSDRTLRQAANLVSRSYLRALGPTRSEWARTLRWSRFITLLDAFLRHADETGKSWPQLRALVHENEDLRHSA